MRVSNANPQLPNISDQKGRDRSASQKDEGSSFAVTLKSKSKDSPATSRDTKTKHQDKKETYQDLAGGEPQNTAHSSAENWNEKISTKTQSSDADPVLKEDLRPTVQENSLLNSMKKQPGFEEKQGQVSTETTKALGFAPSNIKVSEDSFSGVMTENGEVTTPQLKAKVASQSLDGALLEGDENVSFGLQDEKKIKTPLSTPFSSDLKNKTLENQGLENQNLKSQNLESQNTLADLMKEMELLETPEVLDSVKNSQKATMALQEKALGHVNIKEGFKTPESMAQSSQIDPSIAEGVSASDNLIPSVSEMKSGSAFAESSPEFAQDRAQEGSDFTSNFAAVDQQNQVDFAKPLGAAQANVMGEVAPDSKIENMSSIIREARAIVDDGGGSMEVHLQPEGLGKVQLKVAVQEGRINVEMMTDNPAAKKALEEGLFEVRNALEGQKLLVDTLKVEMGQNVQKDFTDMRDHMQDQQNREFAQDFLEQFRQDRESRFGGLIDRFRNSPAPMGQSELKLTRHNPYAEGGKGRTLNLVA